MKRRICVNVKAKQGPFVYLQIVRYIGGVPHFTYLDILFFLYGTAMLCANLLFPISLSDFSLARIRIFGSNASGRRMVQRLVEAVVMMRAVWMFRFG